MAPELLFFSAISSCDVVGESGNKIQAQGRPELKLQTQNEDFSDFGDSSLTVMKL